MTKRLDQNGPRFRLLTASEIENVSGGVVSFRDGSAQRLRQDREDLRERLASGDEASFALFFEPPSEDGEAVRAEAPANATFVVSEDVDGDGSADGLTFLDEDGNYISYTSLNEAFDNYIDNNLDGSNLPWHSSADTHAIISGQADGEQGGWFACVGGGVFGAVAGICGATNPTDLYGYGGVGTPGPDLSAGYAYDTEGILTGTGVNVPGAAISLEDPENGAIQVGIPGFDVRYGFSFSDLWQSFVNALADARERAKVEEAINDAKEWQDADAREQQKVDEAIEQWNEY